MKIFSLKRKINSCKHLERIDIGKLVHISPECTTDLLIILISRLISKDMVFRITNFTYSLKRRKMNIYAQKNRGYRKTCRYFLHRTIHNLIKFNSANLENTLDVLKYLILNFKYYILDWNEFFQICIISYFGFTFIILPSP